MRMTEHPWIWGRVTGPAPRVGDVVEGTRGQPWRVQYTCRGYFGHSSADTLVRAAPIPHWGWVERHEVRVGAKLRLHPDPTWYHEVGEEEGLREPLVED